MPIKKVTRSSASKKQRQEISTASGSSPRKGTRTKKSLQSPTVTIITHQVLTATKEAKSSEESSNDGNSTGDENALIVTPVKMALNLTANPNPSLDK